MIKINDMKKSILYILFLVMVAVTGQAQTKKQFVNFADNALTNKDYYTALVNYQKALEFNEKDQEILWKAAESARNFSSYKIAAQYYEKLIQLDKDNKYPTASFYLGSMYRSLGKTEEAKTSFENFISKSASDDPIMTDKARKNIEYINWALPRMNDMEAEPDAKVTKLGSNVNSPYSDIDPIMINDTLYFSSMRNINVKDKFKPHRRISQVFTSIKDGDSNPMDSTFNSAERHTAHFSYNTKKTRVYFTFCEHTNAYDIRCDLYYREVSADGKYGEPVMLPEPVNAPGYTTTQPNIGYDQKSEREILYFVSDRAGGKGRLDIYYSVINKDGSFAAPVNIEYLNTPDNDITPYFHNPTQTLYFSTWERNGFGGFDIFSTKYNDGKWGEPENLGLPINSTYNDLYFSLGDDGSVGYLASNREGTAYLDPDQEACCNDIFKVDYEKVMLEALTFDGSTREALKGCTVTLTDLSDPNNPKVVTMPDTNFYEFPLKKGREYTIVATKQGFLPDSAHISTKNATGKIRKELYLLPEMIELEALTFNKRTQAPLNGCTVKIIDESEPDKEIVAQMDEDKNSIMLPVKRGRVYKVTAYKKGFGPDNQTVDTRGSTAKRLQVKLYLGDGNLDDYLPLTLYFDNDQPNPRSFAKTTKTKYTDVVNPYLGKKELFKKKYTALLKGDAKLQALNEMSGFFDNKVLASNEHLSAFLQSLEYTLQLGNNVVIEVQGYTSPLASSAYNDALSWRRIRNVVNEIRNYKNGALAKYFDSKQLSIEEKAFGKSTAPRDVSSNPKDPRMSIYSIPASRERRVEIINVKVSK